MHRNIYSYRTFNENGLAKYILFGYIFIVVIFIVIYFFPSMDKMYFQSYKEYEAGIDIKYQTVLKNAEMNMKEYNDDKINKLQIMYELNHASNSLMSIYNSFRWNVGDDTTKELYLLKKQIILTYAEIYKNRSKGIARGVIPNEYEENTFISSLTLYYNDKDKLEKQKYRIPFQENSRIIIPPHY